jgi:hypothetical protein
MHGAHSFNRLEHFQEIETIGESAHDFNDKRFPRQTRIGPQKPASTRGL